MKKVVRQWGLPALTSILVSIFPVWFLFCQNADEVDIVEMLPVLFRYAGVGIVIFLIFALLVKRTGKSAIFTAVLMLILTNFVLLENGMKLLVPQLKYWHTLPILLFIAGHLIWFIWRRMPDDLAQTVASVLSLVFGALILMNLATSAPQIINRIQAKQQQSELAAVPQQAQQAVSGKPNIYLFVFDEYANFRQMEDGYNYDNAMLKDFLTENNFTISYTSHNDSISTVTVLTNLANLDYVVNNSTSASDMETLRKSGALFSLMRENGYRVQVMEVENFFGQESPVRGKASSSAVTAGGESFLDICMAMTALYPFHRNNHAESMTEIMNVVQYVSNMDAPSASTFTLTYLCFPHVPFLVDENGNAVPTEQNLNLKEDKYYLGQYIYATKLMIQMLENILEKDPDAAIMVCSDHGVRATTDRDLFLEGKFAYEYASNPLDVVYYQGKLLPEIEGQSGVNTLRILLNAVWGTDFALLDVPEDTSVYK
ncbi:MAG: hypothetical protein J1E43_04175 [Christensenellaceae bacterium]|nr:hypothetical protein [Christensenellaceae bacterium]